MTLKKKHKTDTSKKQFIKPRHDLLQMGNDLEGCFDNSVATINEWEWPAGFPRNDEKGMHETRH